MYTYEFEIKIGVLVNMLHLSVVILVLRFTDLKTLNLSVHTFDSYFCFHFSYIMKIKNVPENEIILTPFLQFSIFF